MFSVKKIAIFMVAGSLSVVGSTALVQAAEVPMAGIAVALDDFYNNAENTDVIAVNNLLDEIEIENNLAFAQVTNFVNIRNKSSEEGDIIGKLYNKDAATILGEEDGWYKIKSGSVTGYINGDYLITGEKAVAIAKKVGNRIAEVNTETLFVREKASTDSPILNLIGMGDDLKVVKELDGWAKVQLDENTYGFVSTDYVNIQTRYEEAVSIEEEQQRLEEENSTNQVNNNSNSQSSTVKNYSSVGSSSTGNSIADYAVQFVGNPYVWGGTSLTNGADCSGFVQSVFSRFGISVPRTSRSQATGGTRVSLSNIRTGDLIFYAKGGTINHVAIYIGNGRVISASSPSTGIKIAAYNYRTPVKAVRYN